MQKRPSQAESTRLIDQLLKNKTGDALNICAEAYDIITASADSSAAFKYFCIAEFSDQSAEKEPVIQRFTKDQQKDLIERKGALVDGFFDAILQENYEEDQFYTVLWNKIETESLLPGDEDKIFALYYIWIDNRIPYFRLGQRLSIPDSEIDSYFNKLKANFRKARFIICLKNESMIAKASYILDIANELNDHIDQAVFLACAFVIFLQSTKKTNEQED